MTHHEPVRLVALGGERQEEVAKGREEILGRLFSAHTSRERRREGDGGGRGRQKKKKNARKTKRKRAPNPFFLFFFYVFFPTRTHLVKQVKLVLTDAGHEGRESVQSRVLAASEGKARGEAGFLSTWSSRASQTVL